MTKYFILGLLFTLLSCEKEKTFCGCGSENPTKNIEWLNSIINHYENDKNHNWSVVNLYMYDYNNSNAFIFEAKEIGLYDIPTSIHDCEGRIIFRCGGLQPPQVESCNVFFQSATNKTLLWSKK